MAGRGSKQYSSSTPMDLDESEDEKATSTLEEGSKIAERKRDLQMTENAAGGGSESNVDRKKEYM